MFQQMEFAQLNVHFSQHVKGEVQFYTSKSGDFGEHEKSSIKPFMAPEGELCEVW